MNEVVRTTGVWRLQVTSREATLLRVATGETMELDDVEPALVARVFAGLEAGCSLPEALTELAHLDETPEAALDLFEEHGVLHRVAQDSKKGPIVGEGIVAENLRRVVASHGTGPSEPLFAFDAGGTALQIEPWPQAGLVSATLGPIAIAARACPGCLVLRALGRLLARGDDASKLSGSPDAALYAELLWALEAEPLLAGEGVWLGSGEAEKGKVLPHPDCSCGQARVDRSFDTMQARLASEKGTSITAEAFRSAGGALVESPFSPAQLHSVHGGLADVPLGMPFVWGDTRLVRRLGAALTSVSISGIIHGGGRTAAECELISMSEAVERLAAQSATPDVTLSPAVASEQRALHDDWEHVGGESFCLGMDLLRGAQCLVPFERVVVGLAPAHGTLVGYRDSTFTGAASHVTLAEAVLHGTVEAIKRDAFMLSWYRKRALRRLTVEPEEHSEANARTLFLEQLGFRLEWFDMTLDLPLPHVLLRLTAERQRSSWPVGGALLFPAAGWQPNEAILHALKLACIRVVSLCHSASRGSDPMNQDEVEALAQQAPFWPAMARYLRPGSASHHDFLGSGGTCSLRDLPALPTEAPAQRLARLRDLLRERRLAWTVVRLTDATALSFGFEACRVVMPTLVRVTLTREAAVRSTRLLMPIVDATVATPQLEPHPIY